MTVAPQKQKIDPCSIVDFSPVSEADLEEMLVLVSKFSQAEPHCVAIGFDDECSNEAFYDVVLSSLQCKYSLKVTDKVTGELVGCRLHTIGYRDKEGDGYPDEPKDQRVKWLVDVLHDVKPKFYSLVNPEVNKVVRREISFVDPRYQRKGIAQHMLWLGLDPETLKADGVDGIVSEAASIANQTLLEKNGFAVIAEADPKCYFFNGNPVVMPDSTQNMKLMFRDCRHFL